MRPPRVNRRVTRRVVRRPAGVAPVLRRALRVHACATQMIARHTRVPARVAVAELLLARSTTMFATTVSQQYVLNLPVLERHVSMRTRAGGSVTRTVERLLPAVATSAGTATVARIGAGAAMLRELTLRHLVTERVRREYDATGRTPEATGGQADHAGMPSAPLAWQPAAHPGQHLAGLTLARPKPIALPAVPGTASTRDGFDSSSPSKGAGAGAAASERDLERLTERVIGSIDRRLVAQRERFGRP